MTLGTMEERGAKGEHRIVRYGDLRPCFDAFIDTRTPGSDKKENFTIIGPGVSENPDQYVHIAEPHGFNIGGARQPPGCVNSQHSHETAEVFYVHSGTWSFNLGEHGTDAQITLRPGDLISIPTRVFRGFENIGEDIGFLWAVLGGDDPGRVLWAPKVFDMAKDYGLVLLEDGMLIDTKRGETVPEGKRPMPATTREQVNALQVFNGDQLRECCILSDEAVAEKRSNQATLRTLVRSGTKLGWRHGFSVDEIRMTPGARTKAEISDLPHVLFVHKGTVQVSVDNVIWSLGPGDTATIPVGAVRYMTNAEAAPAVLLQVLGDQQ